MLGNALNGEPLSRQVSQSLVNPSSLTGYREIFRQSSNPESGFVELQVEKSNKWDRKYVTFDNGSLKFFKDALSRDNPEVTILMDRVVSLRTDNNAAEPTITITTTEKRYRLRLSTMDEMRKWLFSFHRSVAIVLTHILESRKSHAESEDRKVWLRELGNGHGDHYLKRQTSTSRSYTMEDVGGKYMSGDVLIDRSRWNAESGGPLSRMNSRSVFDQHLEAAQQATVPPKIVAISPAIPIAGGKLLVVDEDEDEEPYRERVASSYRNEEFSPLTEIMRQQPSAFRGHDHDDEDEDLGSRSREDSLADDMMFDMDENIDEKNISKSGSGHMSSHASHAQHSSSDKSKKQQAQSLPIGDELLRMSRNSNSATASASTSRHTTPRSSFSMQRDDALIPVKSSSSGRNIRWESGYCTKLGPREKNEDRFVSLPNLNERFPAAVGAVASSSSANRSTTSALSAELGGENGLNKGNFASGLSRSLLTSSIKGGNPQIANNQGGGTDNSIGYFAVYDGHVGDQAAIYLQENLHEKIFRHEMFFADPEGAIIETCIDVDKEFLDLCKIKKQYCGTTALGAFILGAELVVFNIGDSMAILCSKGQPKEMSDSHKPNREDEQERIRLANGWITEERELYMARLHRMDYNDPVAVDKAKEMNWVTIYRLCGELAITRSIGDPDYKNMTPGVKTDAFFLWPDGHSQIFMADLVIPDPDVKKHSLSPDDEFLVLASDGLWDVVSPAEACKHIKAAFNSGKSPTEAADELCSLALRLGSSDNVTIVIVRFQHSS